MTGEILYRDTSKRCNEDGPVETVEEKLCTEDSADKKAFPRLISEEKFMLVGYDEGDCISLECFFRDISVLLGWQDQATT